MYKEVVTRNLSFQKLIYEEIGKIPCYALIKTCMYIYNEMPTNVISCQIVINFVVILCKSNLIRLNELLVSL